MVNQSVNGPHRGKAAPPTFLGEKRCRTRSEAGHRRWSLADWVTAPDNPFFARATVNRLWCGLLRARIIHPVDDMRETTPESVPGLLDALAKELVDSTATTSSTVIGSS